jgi:chromosome segregation ATPase
LRDVYQNISDVSMESIHKLDDVYYSILERLSTLQHTIGGLQVLSMQTKDLKTTFDEEAKQIGEDVDKQIVTFGGFSKQKMRIEQLESRIHEGRARTERLTERLEVARDRVQNLENQEAEVQASISCMYCCTYSGIDLC